MLLKTFDLSFFIGFLIGLILTVIISYYYFLFFLSPHAHYLEKAKNEACGILTNNRCAPEALNFTVPGLDINPRNGVVDEPANTVMNVCRIYLERADIEDNACLRLCGCD